MTTPDPRLITESYDHLPDCRHARDVELRDTNPCGSNWQTQEFWYMF
jgi:hypothetical protein